MKWVRLLQLPLLIFTAIVLQRSGVGSVTVFGVHPDIVMLVVACVGVSRGREIGALSGFFAGLVVDSFLTTPFGLSALVLAVVGYLAGEVERTAPSTPYTLKLLAIGGGSVAGQMLFSAGLYLLGLGDPLRSRALEEIVVVGGINLILAPAGLLLVRIVFGAEEHHLVERR
ncbi:MAG: rod shape-determining protein MreD [Ferrimicrobium sp.]